MKFKITHNCAAALLAVIAVLSVPLSCRKEKEQAEYDLEEVPVQVVNDISVIKSLNGGVEMRMNSTLMQRFSFYKDSTLQAYELYTDGFEVRAYTPDGKLETYITANEAKHVTTYEQESWMAYGDVVIINYIKREKMESDTIWWDRQNKKIHTDCYVRMTSATGMMQGYGMESDEMARNAVILKPFDTYTYIEEDNSKIFIDTLNFIGPRLQRF